MYEGKKHKLCSQDRVSVYTSALLGFLQPERTGDGWRQSEQRFLKSISCPVCLCTLKKILRQPGLEIRDNFLCQQRMFSFTSPQNPEFNIILYGEEKLCNLPRTAKTRLFALLEGLSNFMSQAWKHEPVIEPPGLSIKNKHETNVYVRGSHLLSGASQTHLS